MSNVIAPVKLNEITDGLDRSIKRFEKSINRIIKQIRKRFVGELIVVLLLLILTAISIWIGAIMIDGENIETIIGSFVSTLGLGGLGITVNIKRAYNYWKQFNTNNEGLQIIITGLYLEVDQFGQGMTETVVQQKLNALNARKVCYYKTYSNNATNPNQLVAELLKC